MQFLTHSNSPCLALAECGYPRPPFSGCQAGPQQTPVFGNKLRCEGWESVQTQLFLTLSSYSPHSYNKFSIQTLNEQTRAFRNIQVLSNPKAKIFVCNLPKVKMTSTQLKSSLQSLMHGLFKKKQKKTHSIGTVITDNASCARKHDKTMF